jgi:hypothetical protein
LTGRVASIVEAASAPDFQLKVPLAVSGHTEENCHPNQQAETLFPLRLSRDVRHFVSLPGCRRPGLTLGSHLDIRKTSSRRVMRMKKLSRLSAAGLGPVSYPRVEGTGPKGLQSGAVAERLLVKDRLHKAGFDDSRSWILREICIVAADGARAEGFHSERAIEAVIDYGASPTGNIAFATF